MIEEFGVRHVPEAAQLVAAACRRQGGATSRMAARLADPSAVEALLAGSGVAGVACEEGAGLTGFLAGWRVPLFGDLPAVYIPEWGHAVVDPDRYRDLYAAAAVGWVGGGRTVHALSLFAADHAGEAVWHDLGFGRVVVDRIRHLRPVGRAFGGVEVRRAEPGDGAVVADLRRRTSAHLAEPPVCRRGEYPESGEAIDEALAGCPGYAAFLASVDGTVSGFVDTAPSAGDTPEAMRDPRTARIGGAFTVPSRRRGGIGAGLLDALLAWCRDEGYEACSLDHETANIAGSRFWEAMGFVPVLHSLVRRV